MSGVGAGFDGAVSAFTGAEGAAVGDWLSAWSLEGVVAVEPVATEPGATLSGWAAGGLAAAVAGEFGCRGGLIRGGSLRRGVFRLGGGSCGCGGVAAGVHAGGTAGGGGKGEEAGQEENGAAGGAGSLHSVSFIDACLGRRRGRQRLGVYRVGGCRAISVCTTFHALGWMQRPPRGRTASGKLSGWGCVVWRSPGQAANRR